MSWHPTAEEQQREFMPFPYILLYTMPPSGCQEKSLVRQFGDSVEQVMGIHQMIVQKIVVINNWGYFFSVQFLLQSVINRKYFIHRDNSYLTPLSALKAIIVSLITLKVISKLETYDQSFECYKTINIYIDYVNKYYMTFSFYLFTVMNQSFYQ